MFLSKTTHALAKRALAGEWGKALVDQPLRIDDVPGVAQLTNEQRYAAAIEKIAAEAPIRILPGERIVGAATLKLAACHFVPAYYQDKPIFSSVSHTTLGFDRVLRLGYNGLEQEIDQRLQDTELDQGGNDFLCSMKKCLQAARVWHRRYMDLLQALAATSNEKEQPRYQEIINALEHVPDNPPRTFRQAVQSLWFMFCFQRHCGNWPGIGRIDEMLGPYLDNDLANATITIDQARELLAHFWIRGCDWIGANEFRGTGDAQHYQNIILGGIDKEGKEITNHVTYLVLDVVEELKISDFPIGVRISKRSPERLLRRVAEVQRQGGGIVAVYNEDLIIENLVDFGYSLEEARCFANDGCWEVIIPGKTNFGYLPFDVLQILQRTIGLTGNDELAFTDFEDLYAQFKRQLSTAIEKLHQTIDTSVRPHPATLVSLLQEDCIKNARGYFEFGCRYTVRAPHAGGIPDAANNLLVFKRLVFDEKRIRFRELVRCLQSNWNGYDTLRNYVRNEVVLFGNDDPEADRMVRRIYDDFIHFASQVKQRNGIMRPPGISTFGRQITWKGDRIASADGHFRQEALSNNFSPSPGTDKQGPTAVLKSHCSVDLSKLTNGTALDLKIHPSGLEGETGLIVLTGLLKTFLALGGIFLHIDVVDNEMLRQAQEFPERFQNLAVRISGWSARFVTLNKEWQDMIIERTNHPCQTAPDHTRH